jgi:hypothetical protein
MKCLRLNCYSPTACRGFGHCRERNFDGTRIELAAHERERVIAALILLETTDREAGHGEEARMTRDLVERMEVLR